MKLKDECNIFCGSGGGGDVTYVTVSLLNEKKN